MTTGPGPTAPTWRDPIAAPPPAPGPAWRAAPPRVPYRPRWWKLAGVAGLALGCLAALTSAALWLRPPAPARLVVLAAGYDTNLAVPPNPYGKAAARRLAGLTKPPGGFFGAHRRLHGAADPARLTRGAAADVLPELDRVREPCVVVTVAAHGGRDRDGAFFFPDDATPDPAHRVRVKDVIARLGRLPAAKQKLLLVDATEPPAYPDLGLVHNDFAAALLDLEPAVRDVPNLVVLASTGPDQRSWASPEWGTSAFFHYIDEGLRGAADGDGDRRVTAAELAAYVGPRVRDWARDHRAALQTPVLLPRGPDGESRAAAMHLATTDGTRPPPPAAPSPFDPPAEIEQAWREYRELAAGYPPPTAYTPHLWRQYEAWALRYEQVALAGDADAARAVRGRLAEVRRQIEAARRLDVGPQTLALPSAVGGVPFVPRVPDTFRVGLARVAAAAGPVDRAKVWAEAQAAAAGPDPAAARLLWGRALVEWVAADPLPRLPAVPALLPLVTDGLAVRPAELHFLDMLARHAPAAGLRAEFGPLLRAVLALRVEAEQAVAGLTADGYPYPAAALPVRSGGDDARRQAEDLCFATDPASWKRAEGLVAEARVGYAATAPAVALRRGLLAGSHAGTARLLGLAEWLARGGATADNPDRLARDRELQAVAALWEQVHAFDRQSAAAGPTAGDTTAADVDRLRAGVDGLGAEVARQTERLLTVKPEFSGDRAGPRADAARWLHHAEAVLAAPPPDAVAPPRRRELLREYRRVSRQLHVTGHTRPDPLPEVSPEATREHAFEAARRRGLALLAALPADEWPPPGDAADRVAFRLNRFPFQADGRQTLAEAGSRLGEALAGPPATADNARRRRWARLAPPGGPAADGPVAEWRRAVARDWLFGQAGRTLKDHWAGGAGEPYFRAAVRSLEADALRLLPPARAGGDEARRFAPLLAADPPFPTVPQVPRRLVFTDEPAPGFDLTWTPAKDRPPPAASPGFAVFWAAPPFAPVDRPAPPRTVVSTDPAAAVPTVRQAIPRPADPPATPVARSGPLRVGGFYRGRTLDLSTPVDVYPVPHQAAVSTPGLPTATVALRASPTLQAAYGEAAGSVAFVLDASGSMRANPDVDGDPGHFPEGRRVLLQLLRGLPAGTHVSVWAFGQRTAEAKTAEDTIRELRQPGPWPRRPDAATGEVEALANGLEPWDKSPVVRTLVRAKASLAAAPGPFKAVVLISDTADNRYADDPAFAKAKRPLGETLRAEFDARGVALGVVAFRPSDPADAASQAAFRAAAVASGGPFVFTPEADRVLAWLRLRLNPRIRYSLEPVAAPGAVAADLDAGTPGQDAWAAERFPPGDYRLSVRGAEGFTRPVRLEPGDRLLLDLVEDRGTLELRRVSFAATAAAVGRTGRGLAAEPPWRLAVLQARKPGPGRVDLTAALDRRTAAMDAYSQTRTGDVWFEVDPAGPAAGPAAVRWRPALGFPSPAWLVDAFGWPDAGPTAAPPVVRLWWDPDGPFPAAAPRAPAPRPRVAGPTYDVDTDAGPVTVRGVTLEDHPVEVRPGAVARKRCLVVRLAYPPDRPFWVRPVGLRPDGGEVRVFRTANRVTCLFWWADRDPDAATVDGALARFEFVSLAAAKARAEAAGHVLRLDDLPGPADAPPLVKPDPLTP